jgi:hypothetical protein
LGILKKGGTKEFKEIQGGPERTTEEFDKRVLEFFDQREETFRKETEKKIY